MIHVIFGEFLLNLMHVESKVDCIFFIWILIWKRNNLHVFHFLQSWLFIHQYISLYEFVEVVQIVPWFIHFGRDIQGLPHTHWFGKGCFWRNFPSYWLQGVECNDTQSSGSFMPSSFGTVLVGLLWSSWLPVEI